MKWFLHKDYLEELQGDLEEVFLDDLALYSIKKAKLLYLVGTLKLLRPSLLRKQFQTQKINQLAMLQHYIFISLRGFKRHKTSFLINLIGLSTGMAASLLILLWVNDERSVDTFHENDEQLYWAMTHFQLMDTQVTWEYTSGRLGKALKEAFPEVEEAVWIGDKYFRANGVLTVDEANYEVNGIFASPNFFLSTQL